jgi:hypothetical protein
MPNNFGHLVVSDALTQLYQNQAALLTDEHDGKAVLDIIDECREAAQLLIEATGFDQQDSDDFGDAYGEIVQPVLMVALMRSKQMRERILENEIGQVD